MIASVHRLRKKLSPLMWLMVCCAVILSLGIGDRRSQRVMAGEHRNHTLIIDPGHGGIDGGAAGIDGSKESDINLAISLKMRAIAEFYGLDNRMTRQDDSTLSSTDSYSEHSDLVERLNFAAKAASPVLISIHQNSYPTSQPSGSQVIYAPSDGSETLGKLTHENIINSLDPQNRRVAEPATSRIYILANANVPAILVECGFVSSFVDISKLTDGVFQSKMAAVIMASYIQYMNLKDTEAILA